MEADQGGGGEAGGQGQGGGGAGAQGAGGGEGGGPGGPLAPPGSGRGKRRRGEERGAGEAEGAPRPASPSPEPTLTDWDSESPPPRQYAPPRRRPGTVAGWAGGDVAELAHYVKPAGKTRGRRDKRGPRPFSDLVSRAGRPGERGPEMVKRYPEPHG